MESKKADIKADIQTSIGDVRQIEQNIMSYSKSGVQALDEEMIVNNVIVPIINGFKAIEGVGAVTTMSDDSMETKIYIKL